MLRMYDVIDRKKKGEELSEEEIRFAVSGYIKDQIPDYQMAAFLMTVYYQGMTERELLALTDCMARSGDMVDLSAIEGIKVDKHSTGGVGDKTTLVVAPIVAACGGKVAKMSGRGLGFTGGTIDKLESIPGLQTAIDQQKFFDTVNKLGLCVIGQSAQIAPADKKLYALRDVTATVDSIPLIAASIMSKKLASGSDKIILDVTVGSGAFMKSVEDAVELAKKMVSIGEGAGRQTIAIITNMDVPLGRAVGNEIEVLEAIATLKGRGPEDFQKICIEFAAYMLFLGEIASLEQCREMAAAALREGTALEKFAQMVEGQGGDSSYIYQPEKFMPSKYQSNLKMKVSGYITHMDTELCGKTAVVLGAGRETKDSEIDTKAGIHFYYKTGDYVKAGEPLAVLYSSDENKLKEGLSCLEKAYVFGNRPIEIMREIIAYVSRDGVKYVG